ncbi:MAG: 2-keto-3-deoxy-phosphogluconate aldolase [Mahella sp.]|nr:2-keto-3-deoxy-phosphogluconate aldolase [Mahella sp.]
MLQKLMIEQRIIEAGVVAVVRAEGVEKALNIADACMQGGISAIEITFTVPGAVEVIKELNSHYGDRLVLGAGTVLDAETARLAIINGANYVVSPSLNIDTVKLCNRYQIPCLPGAMTVKEAVEGMEAGADIIKIFPGELFGPDIIKAFKGPLPQASFMPTGGISLDNAEKWITAGAVALGVGGALTGRSKDGDYTAVTETARKFIDIVHRARGK